MRRAKAGEKLTTLDGKDHDLSPEDLLITDSPNGQHGSRILGIAGVMGGLYGEVTAETKNVLLESAHLTRSPSRVRPSPQDSFRGVESVSNAAWTSHCSRQPRRWQPN